MKNGKETKKSSPRSQDPEITGFSYDEFFNNRLSLPEKLKAHLKEKGLDWRFINGVEFRKAGGMHKAYWQPFKVDDSVDLGLGIAGTTAEGLIQRGDLILAVRQKQISGRHKDFLAKRNAMMAGENKRAAQELRQMMKDEGISDQASVYEGYEENE